MRDTDLSRGSAVEMFEHTNRDKAWLGTVAPRLLSLLLFAANLNSLTI